MKTQVLYALVGAVLLSGCGTTASNVMTLIPDKAGVIQINDSGLDDDVTLVAGKSFYKDELMEVVVNVRSNEDEEVRAEHSWRWFDRQGVEMESTSVVWTPIIINAKESRQFTSLAPRPGATRCEFYMRRPLKS